LLVALASLPAASQTREQTENRIASLPADQRAFERYRAWIAGLPVADRGSGGIGSQQTGELFEKYRVWLIEGGFSDTDISAQITIVQNQGDRMEAERWNRYFTAEKPAFNTAPNAFLVEMVKGRKPGRALDVAMGQGRNTIWLAQQGWDVTGFDPADQAVGVARENAARLGLTIHTEIATMERFEFGENR
jgi:tRNA/tmRNA/rRNA uracil-C5-methylase (TrmA/RlmC/RlmD family)